MQRIGLATRVALSLCTALLLFAGSAVMVDTAEAQKKTKSTKTEAKFISYGPARISSAPRVGKHAELGIDMKPHMPTAPENMKHVILKDHVWWGDHEVELTERFNAWLTK